MSPLLFIIAMEPLQRLLSLSTERNILSPPNIRLACFRSSFYANDAALFVNPVHGDFVAVQAILNFFADGSGLRTNIHKTVVYPISYMGIDLVPLMADFGGKQGVFPCHYLGLPLGVRKPRRIEMQPLIDKIKDKLAPRKGGLLNRMRRLVYTNSVVTAMATYFLTAFPPDKWLIKKVDKLRKNFHWEAEDQSIGAKSMVNWKQVCSPKKYGGLGIKNIECFSRALRLRWEWFKWGDGERPWKGFATPCDDMDRQLFSSCTTIDPSACGCAFGLRFQDQAQALSSSLAGDSATAPKFCSFQCR